MKSNRRVAEGFGRNLRAARKRAGLTQDEVGRLIGVDKSDIARIERGGVVPKIDRVLVLAKALGIEPSELLAGLEA